MVLLGFYWVLPGFTGFYWFFTGFYRVLLGLTEFNFVLLVFTGFCRFLFNFTGFYLVLLFNFQFLREQKTNVEQFDEFERWRREKSDAGRRDGQPPPPARHPRVPGPQ